MYTKNYRNIASLKLLSVLNELKSDLVSLVTDELELFKCEFILEELLTNSFTHASPISEIILQMNIKSDHYEIQYCEVGVANLDFLQLLLSGQETATNASVDKMGGLGLHLINQMSRQFTYEYDFECSTRRFNVII